MDAANCFQNISGGSECFRSLCSQVGLLGALSEAVTMRESSGEPREGETGVQSECTNLAQISGAIPEGTGKKAPPPSNSCHICGKKGWKTGMVVCRNIVIGACRKAVCKECFNKVWKFPTGDYNEFDKACKDRTRPCPHCEDACPDKAQCKAYEKANAAMSLKRQIDKARQEDKDWFSLWYPEREFPLTDISGFSFFGWCPQAFAEMSTESFFPDPCYLNISSPPRVLAAPWSPSEPEDGQQAIMPSIQALLPPQKNGDATLLTPNRAQAFPILSQVPLSPVPELLTLPALPGDEAS